MGKQIEVEHGELAVRNSNGDIAIIPKHMVPEVRGMIQDGCHGCLDNYISTLPKMKDYAEDGTLIPKKKVTNRQGVTFEEYQSKLNNLQPGFGDEGPNYNLRGAWDGGLEPELADDGNYHLGSRNPYTGEILKSEDHPTFGLAIQGEKEAGYEPYKDDNGKWYSQQSKGSQLAENIASKAQENIDRVNKGKASMEEFGKANPNYVAPKGEDSEITYPADDLRRDGVVPPNTEFMAPNMSGKAKSDFVKSNNDIIGMAVPMPGLEKIGKFPGLVDESMKLAGRAISKGKPFKSEINWAKWNKEIPDNKKLIKEYHSIEKTKKLDGTWMKNSDGSPFQGTPEEFIQINSTNFKKAFSKGFDITYRGARRHHPELDYNPIFTADKKMANEYTTAHGDYWNSNHPDLMVTTVDDKKSGGLHKLYYNNKIKTLKVDAKNRDWTDLNVPEIDKNKLISTDDVARFVAGKQQLYLSNRNEPLMNAVIDNVYDGTSFPGTVRIIPHVEDSYLKSSIGNNGMFDMKNPNIYKGLTGLGLISNGMLNKKNKTKKRQ